ncbi:hypothetical protein GC174_10220 [bacterium]|nr:hypothetical protein [bacterium]
MLAFVPLKLEVENPDRYIAHLSKDGTIYTYGFSMKGIHEGFSSLSEARGCVDMDDEFLFATHNDPTAYLIESAVVSFDYARHRKIAALEGKFFEPTTISMEHDKTKGRWIFKAESDTNANQSMIFNVSGGTERVKISWNDILCNAERVITTWHLDKRLDNGTEHLLNCILYLHQANLSRDN